MAKTRRSSFSHRKLDLVSEELIAVLFSKASSFEFNQLFNIVHGNLRMRPERSVHGGETMLRLRAYEKLQILVKKGAVKKTITVAGKCYQGIPDQLFAIKMASDSEKSFFQK
jgi:hypothetical protein